jgi:serine/threonine-protein kinase
MPSNPRVRELLEELLDSGKTPEEVCRDCPELLPQVREQWKAFRRIDAAVGQVFPALRTPAEAGTTAIVPRAAGLPQIPGYEVEAVLGHGGMGVVYKARQHALDRPVAVKMLLAGPFAGPQDLARFHRETAALASLRHVNIVQVYDAGDVEGRPYFTMELIEGGSLAQKLSGTPQPAGQAARLVATLADAVQVAHRGGIVHRDLKPANILLTADDTPKVTDFGLARRLEGEAGVTQSGVLVGTPSYMAPEQARGHAREIGPAVDVYALGAILYELLTGRPPFRAETPGETVLQVLSQEPVPPARLNSRVPRDLETICLKCLHKEPERRYSSAAALADDLQCFREGRPIRARPPGLAGRLWRWGRRNPAAAVLAAAALGLVGLTVGGGLWMERQQAERRMEAARQEGRESQAVEAVLQQAAGLQKQERWPEVRAALEQAPGLLGTSAPEGLRERVRQARADADMVAELDEIRLRLLEGRKRREPVAPRGDRLYAEAFRRYGIPLLTLEPAEAAARIRQSAIRETLLAFLYDWVLNWESDADRGRLRTVVDRADDDAWRRRLRQALTKVYDPAKREELLQAREALAQPPVVLAGLAAVLSHGPQEEQARALLREAQRLHPEDFWLNFQLGYYLQEERPHEAVGYFRAAVASRPRSSPAHTMLGRALRDTGDVDGAIAAFRNAIALNPNRAGARDLARVLAPGGRLEEARAVWEEILEGDPPDSDAWYGYAQLCAFLGNKKAYRRACKALLEHAEHNTDHWSTAERASLACLLLPASGDDLRRTVALVDLAAATGPKFPDPDHAYVQFVKGLAEFRQGRPGQAVPLLQESAALLPNRAGPRLVLAMAQFRSGSAREARQTLVAAVRAYDWTAPRANHTTAWVNQVLCREAEALLLPNLPALLEGSDPPRDNDERLALLRACQFQGRYGAAARLYADAFAADPNLADHLTTECRYRSLREEHPDDDRMEPLDTEGRLLAARCAALAGGGRGQDGARLSPAERAHWRRQARVLLRADLALWVKTLESGSGPDLALARRMLTHWQAEPDLAGIRDLKALEQASDEERNECFALWDEVGVVLRRTAELERALARDPKRADPRRVVPTELLQQGRLEEARVAWRSALKGNPLDHNAWFGYAELCLFLGREEEYRRARQDLLARFGGTGNVYFAERTGRTCLLRPAAGDELRQAVALIRRAAASVPSVDAWARPWFLFARGLAEYRQGRYDQSIATLRGDASRMDRPIARLVLALALHQDGQVAEARKALAVAIVSYDWRATQAHDHDAWICHLLCREAEGLILPNLQAFRRGAYQPRDTNERLALLAGQLAGCEFQGLPGASARLYSDAFAADPQLADDVAAGTRYRAARAAVLAGCGQGKDAGRLPDEERALWRRQALNWLRQDLTGWGTRHRNGKAQTSAQVRERLQSWQSDPDLAGVRARDALGRLPDEERRQWERLWFDVDALLRRLSPPQ